jgi:Fe-coproporphyrin III synthase
MATLLEPLPTQPIHTSAPTEFPILILHVHTSCNCRCLMCDIWQRKTSATVTAADLERHRHSLRRLRVRQVALTGGEPLLNLDLDHIAQFFHELDIRVTLLTTGLLLKKRAHEVAEHIDEVIVSLDGPPEVHDGIRRVPGAFALIRDGIAAIRSLAPYKRISARCTIQRANHASLEATARAAKAIGFNTLSFLAVDVSSDAFNRPLLWPVARQNEIALTHAEAHILDLQINRLIAFGSVTANAGFLVEKPSKLRAIAQTFRAYLGEAPAVAPACNAPWVSAVIEVDGMVRPCFFHPPIGSLQSSDLESVLTSRTARRFRDSLDVATNPTCQRCVCSLNYKPGRSS